MKPCCVASARRDLKKPQQAARCDVCKSLLMAFSEGRNLEEARKTIKAHGVEFEEARIGTLHVIAKPRQPKPRKG